MCKGFTAISSPLQRLMGAPEQLHCFPEGGLDTDPGRVPASAQGGSIVFISSYTAYHAEAPIALYAVSKTALVALGKALAEELGPAGIRVNCVAPGAEPPRGITTQLCHWQPGRQH